MICVPFSCRIDSFDWFDFSLTYYINIIILIECMVIVLFKHSTCCVYLFFFFFFPYIELKTLLLPPWFSISKHIFSILSIYLSIVLCSFLCIFNCLRMRWKEYVWPNFILINDNSIYLLFHDYRLDFLLRDTFNECVTVQNLREEFIPSELFHKQYSIHMSYFWKHKSIFVIVVIVSSYCSDD